MKIKRLLLVALLFGLPIVAFWFGGFVFKSRNTVQDYLSQSRMAQIRLMLFMYHDHNGVFPPIEYRPEPGGPVHSWRVLLVPYTRRDFRERHSEYDFSKKWNSPSNLQALDFGRQFLHFSMQRDADSDITNYVAIGNDKDWPWEKPMRSWLITKGNDRFLLVEDPDSEIRWMEPKH